MKCALLVLIISLFGTSSCHCHSFLSGSYKVPHDMTVKFTAFYKTNAYRGTPHFPAQSYDFVYEVISSSNPDFVSGQILIEPTHYSSRFPHYQTMVEEYYGELLGKHIRIYDNPSENNIIIFLGALYLENSDILVRRTTERGTLSYRMNKDVFLSEVRDKPVINNL